MPTSLTKKMRDNKWHKGEISPAIRIKVAAAQKFLCPTKVTQSWYKISTISAFVQGLNFIDPNGFNTTILQFG